MFSTRCGETLLIHLLGSIHLGMKNHHFPSFSIRFPLFRYYQTWPQSLFDRLILLY